MHLTSLHIQNFRNLTDLQIPELSRVNLIVGKNNTGKTSVLEAVSLYAKVGSFGWLLELLRHRGYIGEIDYKETSIKEVDKAIDTILSLFYKNNTNHIVVGDLGGNEKKIEIWFEKTENSLNYTNDAGLQIAYCRKLKGFSEKRALLGIMHRTNGFTQEEQVGLGTNCSFTRTTSLNDVGYDKKWDEIVLTELETVVKDALRIIVPQIEGLTFREIRNSENVDSRQPFVSLKDTKQIVPLRSMGDGVNRILNIALDMVTAANGFYLLDEFENGLHYTIQPKVWETIALIAEKLNIQVFVTTHSRDAYLTFGEFFGGEQKLGSIIRLENTINGVEAIDFNSKEIKLATEQSIELR